MSLATNPVIMEVLSPLLDNLSYEMATYQLLEDILHLYKLKQERKHLHLLYLLDIDSSDYEDEIDLEVLLMTRICEIHEESVITRLLYFSDQL